MKFWSCQVREGQNIHGKEAPESLGSWASLLFPSDLANLGHVCEARAAKLGASFLPSFPWSLPQAAMEEWALALSRARLLSFPHQGVFSTVLPGILRLSGGWAFFGVSCTIH